MEQKPGLAVTRVSYCEGWKVKGRRRVNSPMTFGNVAERLGQTMDECSFATFQARREFQLCSITKTFCCSKLTLYYSVYVQVCVCV